MEAKAQEHEVQVSRSSGKEALDHAIAAAELYMKAVREARTPADKARLKRKCEELIARAEGLKAPSAAAVPARPGGPLSSRELPTAEKALLLRSSKLHGAVFPPWESAPSPSAFKLKAPEEPPFTDPTVFSLSTRQRDILSGWKRPKELLAARPPGSPAQHDNAVMTAQAECDLVQDVTTDCSVVASLCAAMRHLRPGKDCILPAVMYPFDHQAGRPAVSENGKYIFRLHFNGCFRQVVVDDRLPASRTARTLFVVDRTNPELLWPALLEKAYLKVRGGYDFPGSNSGTDLCVLTGWIPEQIFLQSDDIELDQTWKRIKNAYDYGDVVVTLGTGQMTPQEEEALGLAGEHDYAVMGMRAEAGGARRMLLKNPWVDCLVWKGVGSSAAGPGPGPDPREDGGGAVTTTGTFWIDLEDVARNFESLYLNWNPSLFTHRQDHHFSWAVPSGPSAMTFDPNPQYTFTAPSSGAVWVLLSRHFQDGELAIARRSRHGGGGGGGGDSDGGDGAGDTGGAPSLAAVSGSLGFTSLHLFAGAHRVDLPDGALHRGAYVDSPQTLLRVDARAGAAYTVVVAQDRLPLARYAFTLSLLSRSPLAAGPAAPALPHRADAAGAWTRRTAGGHAAAATFARNPQFAVRLAGPARRVSLLLACSAPDLPVRVDLVWAGGHRVASLSGAARDLAASSGEYRRGRARAELGAGQGGDGGAALGPGTYTAVVSAFEPGRLADFSLRVAADCPVELRPVPADGAGRLRSPLPPLPLPPGGGAPRPWRAAVRVPRLARACAVARSGGLPGGAGGAAGAGGAGAAEVTPAPGAGALLRVSLELGRGPHRRPLAATAGGDFADAAPGLRTGDVDLDPEAARRAGGLWVVVEQMGQAAPPGGGGGGGGAGGPGWGVQVDVLCDTALEVGPWERVDE